MAADNFSVQLTSIDVPNYQPATAAWYKGGSPHRPLFHGQFAATATNMAKSKTVAMVRLPIGVIPFRASVLIDTSLGSAKYSIGSSSSGAKYRALATSTVVGAWFDYNLPAAMIVLTAAEEIWITNDATADFPTTVAIEMIFECVIP